MKVFEKYSDKISGLANMLGTNVYLETIKDSFLWALPLTIFGSMLVVLMNLPGVSENYINTMSSIFGDTQTVALTIMSLFVSFAIGFFYDYKTSDDTLESLYTGLVTLSAFLILTPFAKVVEGVADPVTGVIPLNYLGAQGMFLAIGGGFIFGKMYIALRNKDISIKMPDSVPPSVSKSFSALIPISITLLIVTAINYVFGMTDYGNAQDFIYHVIQAPLTKVGTSLPGTLFAMVSVHFLWFFGIHGHLTINSVFDPMWMANSLQNIEAYQAGLILPNIITKSFVDVFVVSVGGSGLIAMLIAIFMFSKNKEQRTIAKIGIGPLAFNVFEPVVFGMPIVMNPVYFIPWLLTPIILVCSAYFSMALGIVPLTTGVTVPWTTPVLISGFLATGSIMGTLLQLVQIALLVILWAPFVIAAAKAKDSNIGEE